MDIFRTGEEGGLAQHPIAFEGVFSHYKGDSNTIKLMIKRQTLGQNDQFNVKTPPVE